MVIRTANQLKNLELGAKPFNSETGKKAGKKGGVKSGERRRELKTFRELLEQQLSQKTSDGKILKETITEQLLNLIKTGSEQTKLKAIEMVRDTIGEKPVEKIDNVNPQVQKIFITKEDSKKANQLIDEFIEK